MNTTEAKPRGEVLVLGGMNLCLPKHKHQFVPNIVVVQRLTIASLNSASSDVFPELDIDLGRDTIGSSKELGVDAEDPISSWTGLPQPV